MALAIHPKLLLLDEPVTGMNPVEIQTRLVIKAYIGEVGRIVLEDTAQEIANDERVKKAYLGD
jgi:ABC-type branched-subunit amino acid transport system ATPase component